jgi:hypothetical protein
VVVVVMQFHQESQALDPVLNGLLEVEVVIMEEVDQVLEMVLSVLAEVIIFYCDRFPDLYNENLYTVYAFHRWIKLCRRM